MLDLAINSNNGPVLMKDISRRQNITFKYLGQLFLLLKNSGLIKGQRGASGGYTLCRDPKDMTLLEIVECLEGPISFTDCAADVSICPKSNTCVTHDIWRQTRSMIHNYFSSITLEDLVQRYNEKRKNSCKKNCLEIYTEGEKHETHISG